MANFFSKYICIRIYELKSTIFWLDPVQHLIPLTTILEITNPDPDINKNVDPTGSGSAALFRRQGCSSLAGLPYGNYSQVNVYEVGYGSGSL